MATNFPSSLDSLTNPTSTDALNSPSHADQHANVNDAVEALEAKVGVDGSAVTSSLDFKVTASKTVTDKIDPAGASADQVLKFNGTKFVPATGSSLTASDTPPASPVAGELWYESDTGRTFIRYDSAWVEVGSTATTNVNANDLSGTTLASNVVSSALIPAGSITMYGGSSAPTGYLLCDGSNVSRTTYASLYSAIGTTYGAGDGSTTFAVPNLKGKVPVGRDSSDTSFDVLGETGGAKTHTLTVSEMPSHSHTTTIIAKAFTSALDGLSGGTVNNNAQYYTSDSKGGDQAHNNLQPYIVLNYIIKW